jgi:hypothetical protein
MEHPLIPVTDVPQRSSKKVRKAIMIKVTKELSS